jgi:hypothetical protein
VAILDLQVGASADDCYTRWDGSAWQFSTTSNYQSVGWGDSSSYAKRGGGIRFTNVTIPQGTTITAAYLTFRCNYANSGANCLTKIKGEASDNAAPFSDYSNFSGRSRISASVNWDNIPAWSSDTDYNSPDISSIIQEIVNRPGWASGNALVIFWDDFDDRSTHAIGNWRAAYSYDGSTTYASKLHIEYEIPVTEKTSSDAGSGADAYVSLETPQAKLSSDTGSGAEGTPMPSAILAGSESGSGIEAFIARLLAAAESGYGAEASEIGGGGLLKHLFASELGEGADGLTAKIEIPNKGGGMRLWT